MDIIFNPPVNEENKYIEIMVEPLREYGFRVHELDDLLSNKKHFRSIKLVHLNWFENVDDSTFYRALRSFLRKMFVLGVIRASNKKLVWTMHNRVSHEKRSSFFSRIITQYLIRWSDSIVIHSELSKFILAGEDPAIGAKIRYLPHPDFIGIYGPLTPEVEPTDPSAPLSLLFMGAVKPYKNIEMLIRAVGNFKDTVLLTIAGKPSSSAYHDKIATLAASAGNIKLMLQFIPDHELPLLMAKSDLLILPYDLESSLNSGTVILAFSYKKTAICPEIGTIEDLKGAKENVFHYQYESDKEHLAVLIQKIEQALKMKKANPIAFKSLGDNLFEHVKNVHNKRSVGKKLINLYQSLLE